ncbi:hypothetical protein K1T71_000770 [Dendrolimus kikuchii]|uniref:Uncharacterized protein n=1 Tax=Dendrolimus kikuchii TaxID=765133 RepID=A0ACC1DKV0_9NEOP|nr:hypothetical protein K1T71_000770 [Dendrolimus kikuchii]
MVFTRPDGNHLWSGECDLSMQERRKNTISFGRAACRKRRLNNPQPESHKQKQKRLRIAGLEYINSKGKVVPPKQPGPDCLCRRKCFQNVPEDVRLKIFHGFYSMKSRDERNAYLFGLMRQVDIKRKRVKSSSRRSCTFEYFVRVKGRETQVCQTAFRHIHAINEREVRVLCKKMVDGVMFPSDNRGKNRNKTEQDEIKNHIYSIVHTHRLKDFIRLDKIAGLEINISKMWKDYIKIYDPDNMSAEIPKSKINSETSRQTEAMQPPLTQETFAPISNPDSSLVNIAENDFQNQYQTAALGISTTTNFYRTSNEGQSIKPAQPTALVVSQRKLEPQTSTIIRYNHNTELTKRSDKNVKQSSKDRKRLPVVKKWKYSNIFQNEINGAALAAIKTRLAMYYEESDVPRKKAKAP